MHEDKDGAEVPRGRHRQRTVGREHLTGARVGGKSRIGGPMGVHGMIKRVIGIPNDGPRGRVRRDHGGSLSGKETSSRRLPGWRVRLIRIPGKVGFKGFLKKDFICDFQSF